MPLGTEFCSFEPAHWELITAVRHIFSAKDSEHEHLSWGQIRFEVRMEIFPHRFATDVLIALLHSIVHADHALFL